MEIKTEFNIGDEVYHVLPDSPLGIIIDITYRASSGLIWYEVLFEIIGNTSVCREFELSKTKTF